MWQFINKAEQLFLALKSSEYLWLNNRQITEIQLALFSLFIIDIIEGILIIIPQIRNLFNF